MSYDQSKSDPSGYLTVVVLDFKHSFQFRNLADAIEYIEHVKSRPDNKNLSFNFSVQHFKPDEKNEKFLWEAKEKMKGSE